jgi:hypothetical protein
MNATTPELLAPPRPGRRALATLSAWRHAIASLGPRPWKWAALVGLFGTLLDWGLTLAELRPSVPISSVVQFGAGAAICWAVVVTLGLSAWAIADRSGAQTAGRAGRLAVALGVAVLLQAALGPGLVQLLVGRLDPCLVHECSGKDFSSVPQWLLSSELSGQMLIFGALLFAWLEVQHRNREIEGRLVASQQERARLLRATFDARLTVMQAQVDPQFLFDSLADVEAMYAVDTSRGTATLDRLITYLRAALPRLRSEGSSIGAEAELVTAWLAVVAARRGGRPLSSIEVAPDCAGLPFSATVLLPLVQWALGDLEHLPATFSLTVRRAPQTAGKQVLAQLRIAPSRPCRDDEPAPTRIRERLQALYGDASTLTCRAQPISSGQDSDQSGLVSEITLLWPDESADRDRR